MIDHAREHCEVCGKWLAHNMYRRNSSPASKLLEAVEYEKYKEQNEEHLKKHFTDFMERFTRIAREQQEHSISMSCEGNVLIK